MTPTEKQLTEAGIREGLLMAKDMDKLTIEIDIRTPHPVLYMIANAEEFGRVFAGMAADDQVKVLRSMITHMSPHKQQWDYIAIELDKPENIDIKDILFNLGN